MKICHVDKFLHMTDFFPRVPPVVPVTNMRYGDDDDEDYDFWTDSDQIMSMNDVDTDNDEDYGHMDDDDDHNEEDEDEVDHDDDFNLYENPVSSDTSLTSVSELCPHETFPTSSSSSALSYYVRFWVS